MTDHPRPDATGPDYEYSLPIEAVADRYAAAGFPRTIRTLQRYCASGHLDAQKVATALGDKYYVAPYSVTRHLAQIAEMAQFSPQGSTTTSHDMSRHDASHVDRMSPSHRAAFSHSTRHDSPASGYVATEHDTPRQFEQHPPRQGAASGDTPRPDVVDPALSPKYVEVLERENAFLRDQVTKKDQQIEALLERDRETNFLVQGLQRMLAPLLGAPRADETGRDTSRQ